MGRSKLPSYNWHMPQTLRNRLKVAVTETKSKTLAELLVHIVESWLNANGF